MMKTDLEMLADNEIPMIQDGESVKFSSTCENCGNQFIEEINENPSKDAHGEHGITLCRNC